MTSGRPIRRSSAPRRKVFVILAVVFATVLSLGLAELTCRVFDLPREAAGFGFLGSIVSEEGYESDQGRFWRLREAPPWSNALGLRGYLPAPGERSGRGMRVVCVGDSCTFGAHVRYEEAYGMVLERRLREALPGVPCETILAALPGYTTWQNRVLYAGELLDYRPDVTVFYCGGWNDYVPALGRTDRERATPSRLLRAIRAAMASTPNDADRAALLLESRQVDAEVRRRVSLDEFEANYRAMIDAAASVGSRVVCVIPALDEVTDARTPIAERYRGVVRRLAEELGLAVVDLPALFAEQRAAAEPPADMPATWPCLIDWVHPSVFGHRLIGDALFELFGAQGWLRAASEGVGAQVEVGVDRIEQAGGRLTIRGSGFLEQPIERLFAGPWWLPGFEVLDDARITATIPPGLPAGDWPLTFVGAFGARPTPATVSIVPLEIEVAPRVDPDGGLRISMRADGPPGFRLQAWISPQRSPRPLLTAHGAFLLGDVERARPAGSDRLPFLFDRVPHQSLSGVFDDEGQWRHEFRVEAAVASTLPDRLFLQGLVFEPPATGRAELTALTTIDLQR